MQTDENTIPEEILGLSYHYLSPERQAEVSRVLQALQEDAHLEFLLAIFDVTVNDRPLSPNVRPSRAVLAKLLQALDEEAGAEMLYASPYNHLGIGERIQEEPRLEWWDFDISEFLYEFADIRTLLAFLEHGTGSGTGRPARSARELHDRLLKALVGESRLFTVWSCVNVETPGVQAALRALPETEERLWPAEDVSPWFHGIFWDDLIFVLNPEESTLTVLAITSQ